MEACELLIEAAPKAAGRPLAVVACYPDRRVVVAYSRSLRDAFAIVVGLALRLREATS